ncbi:RagB/SusD family nutrient uptake outer membrane protein [Chitinophaga filiformis]|uniref:Starch-binding associating with outer membrane n=1 Tax=Chitinophaga filiformis TaxID=104663 RepID=A0A1G7HW17_CHIFI|nr:RagB/SusD family nutrient uptake outer membrane protein [Chitinophaga filiformis]SDF04548.1 Starch-binding associating with outer membrane [Chitinophaga filiformis]
MKFKIQKGYLSFSHFGGLLFFIFSALVGCKKLIEVDPPIQSIVGKEIYNSNAGAASVLTGIYAGMAENSFVHGREGVSFRLGLSADELKLYDGNTDVNLDYLYRNSSNSAIGNTFWSSLYAYIFRVNAAIEGISLSKGITEPVKNRLLGESKFLRAFYYFYLVNLYGDVPLLTGTDPDINVIAPRSDKMLVYRKIEEDLIDAQNLLNDNYVAADAIVTSTERVRPNRAAAHALLARVYLYINEWEKAEGEASEVIENTSYKLAPITEVFLMNSSETIFALQSRNATINNLDGLLFNFLSTDLGPNTARPSYLSDYLMNAFEPNDNRKKEWIKSVMNVGVTYYYPNKYKTDLNSTVVTEYPIVLRLGEQYLIRAEARAQQGKLTGDNSAQSDLNLIRERAGLPSINLGTQDALLEAIDRERQVELFTEWGNRWFDLKRRNKVDQVMQEVCAAKGGTWSSFKALFPIPVYDIKTNPSLIGHQNLGYAEQ